MHPVKKFNYLMLIFNIQTLIKYLIIDQLAFVMQQLKSVKAHYLYNMLQDFRHVLIFDLRKQSQFAQNKIRDSFNLFDGISYQIIQQVAEYSIKKGQEKQKKYAQLKKIRRYIFIAESNINLNNLTLIQKNKIQLAISAIPKNQCNKFYGVTDSFKQYYQKYPFTCLVKSQFQKLKELHASPEELDKLLLYPYCRFPTEIIEGMLYLGNVFSSNSEKQLHDLKIKCLVDFIDYQTGEESDIQTILPQFKHNQQKYQLTQLPFNKDIIVNITFDIINATIDDQLCKGPTLLYCKDGQTISAAFAISYLMYKVNLDISMATLKVCQAIGRTNITKWIYSQLLVYKPKKQEKQNIKLQ